MNKYSGLKIAHIDFGFNWPVKGGEQFRVYRVIKGLKESGFYVTLFVPGFREKEVYNFDTVPTKFFYCPKSISLRKKMFPGYKRIVTSLISFCREFKPDIIHYHFGSMKYILNAIAAGNKLGIPKIVTFHQFWPLCYRGTYWDFDGNVCSERNVCGRCMLTVSLVNRVMDMRWRKTVQWIFDSINCFITYSNFMKNKLIDAGVMQEQIFVIPYGVDFENIPSENPKREYIIFSGRLSREKGVDLFIEAVSRIRKRKFKTIIIGDGPQRKEYENLAKHLGLDIQFTGWTNDRNEYYRYLKRGICVVVPSLWIENSPLVIGEAFACRTPVVGTNSGGIPELINNSGAGFVVERSADEIAEKIQVLIEDKKVREEMGKKGRTYAEKYLSWEKNVTRIAEIYEKLAVSK